MMKSVLISFFVTLSASASFAARQAPSPKQKPDCVSQTDVDELAKRFRFLSQDKNLKPDLCDSKNVITTIVRAILFIQALPDSATLLGQKPIDYFSARIETIQFQAQTDPTCEIQGAGENKSGTIAYVYPDRPTVYICPFAAGNDPYEAAAFMLHEARHRDGFDHVKCEHGSMAKYDQKSQSGGSCDESLETRGSYGIQAEFYLGLSKNENIAPAVREASRAESFTYHMNRFNERPLGMRQGVFLQSSENKISFYDGKTNESLGEKKVELLANRLLTPAFFDLTNVTAMSGFTTDETMPTPGDLAQAFKVSMNRKTRSTLLDLYYTQDQEGHDCMLFTDRLLCRSETLGYKWIPLPEAIHPVRFVISKQSSIVVNEILYIADQDGWLWALPKADADLFKPAAPNFKKSSRPYSILGLADWKDGSDLAVTSAGQLATYSSATRQWAPVELLRDQSFKKILGTFYWSKRLSEL